MKMHTIVTAIVMFAFGGLVGHTVTLPSSVQAEARSAYDLPLELTRKAQNLPLESADAI